MKISNKLIVLVEMCYFVILYHENSWCLEEIGADSAEAAALGKSVLS